MDTFPSNVLCQSELANEMRTICTTRSAALFSNYLRARRDGRMRRPLCHSTQPWTESKLNVLEIVAEGRNVGTQVVVQ